MARGTGRAHGYSDVWKALYPYWFIFQAIITIGAAGRSTVGQREAQVTDQVANAVFAGLAVGVVGGTVLLLVLRTLIVGWDFVPPPDAGAFKAWPWLAGLCGSLGIAWEFRRQWW